MIPIIFGAPGRYKSGLQIPAVPALELTLTEDSAAGRVRWIIASHHLTGFVVNSLTRPTTAGRIYNLGGSGLRSAIMGITTSGTANPMMLHNATDHKGNEVAFIENNITSNYGPFSAGDVESGGEFWFGFTDQQVGGLANPYRDGLLDGCSDVVRYILERYSGQRVDKSRMEAEAADLNNLKIDCVINAATTATKWIESLANVYPLRMVQGPDGVYVKRRRYTADRSQAVAALATKGQSGNIGVSRRSGLVLVEDEIYNSIRVEYAPRKMGQDYQASVTVGASEQVQTQLTAGTVGLVPKNIQGASRVAEGSQASYGLREKVVSAPTCFDESTAAAIGVAMAERYAMPRYAVTYTGDRSLETLNPGDVVTIADPDLTDNRRLAIVDDVVIGSRQPTVVLELVSDPIAWTVSTG